MIGISYVSDSLFRRFGNALGEGGGASDGTVLVPEAKTALLSGMSEET